MNAKVDTTGSATRLIDPATLMRIRSLELRAKTVVEGLWNGLHRSPYHGFSVEFTEYRQYSEGDDPRYIDWRLYARSDRYYIKRFEDETNLRCQLVLDTSRSMSYGSVGYAKAEYARTLAATLGYFLITQRDAVGLATFDERINEYIPARYRPGQLRRLLVALERPCDGTATDLTIPLDEITERVRKRGLIVLISDLLAPVELWDKSLGQLRARGHEVAVFQVLDPAEVAFDFEQPALFEDVETGRAIYVDPVSARESYLQKLAAHQESLRTSCSKLGVAYSQCTTDEPLEQMLAEFLRNRLHGAGTAQHRRPRSASTVAGRVPA